jgi:hypothetical protein
MTFGCCLPAEMDMHPIQGWSKLLIRCCPLPAARVHHGPGAQQGGSSGVTQCGVHEGEGGCLTLQEGVHVLTADINNSGF